MSGVLIPKADRSSTLLSSTSTHSILCDQNGKAIAFPFWYGFVDNSLAMGARFSCEVGKMILDELDWIIT
jgi:hypothetical protein